MNRRTLRLLALVAAAGTGVGGVVATAGPGAAAPKASAKNVIYMVGDGMGFTHVTAGRQRFFGADGQLTMESFPVDGHVSTYAVDENSDKPDLVTDSASAGTAWASGVKTYNNALGVDAFGKVVKTVMEQAKAAGLRTGNVTTSEITDATPAAQMSHVLLRGCQGPDGGRTSAACNNPSNPVTSTDDLVYTPVAEQIARNGTADVILGGGLNRFEAEDQLAMEAQGYDVLGSFGTAAADPRNDVPGSEVVASRAELLSTSSDKVIGLFNRGNLTVEKAKADLRAAGRGSEAAALEPTLAEMTTKAIELLSKGQKPGKAKGTGEGFYLQVEGALIDKRSHANDASQTLEEIKAFDDAVAVAKAFAEKDGNTLVVVTADHECAGFNIVGKGSFTNAEAAAPPTNVDSSNTANNSTPSRTSGNTRDTTRSSGPVNGIGANGKNFAPATFGTPDDAANFRALDGTTDASLWLTYLSGNHTGADIPVFAFGPGSAPFNGGQDNTDHYRFVTAALGLS